MKNKNLKIDIRINFEISKKSIKKIVLFMFQLIIIHTVY